MRKMKQGLSDTPRAYNAIGWWNLSVALRSVTPCKDDKSKYTEIMPFKAGSDYNLSAKGGLKVD